MLGILVISLTIFHPSTFLFSLCRFYGLGKYLKIEVFSSKVLEKKSCKISQHAKKLLSFLRLMRFFLWPSTIFPELYHKKVGLVQSMKNLYRKLYLICMKCQLGQMFQVKEITLKMSIKNPTEDRFCDIFLEF